MSTYTRSDFGQIAAAIGIAAEQLANHETKFETTALWFRLDKGRPRRVAPSKRRERLNQVAKSARRLLKSLGINDPAEAADGPGDREILSSWSASLMRSDNGSHAPNWPFGGARRIHQCSSRVRGPRPKGSH